MTQVETAKPSAADGIFDQLRSAIDHACTARDSQIALDAVTAAGLQKRDVSRGMSTRLEFQATFAGGAVTLEFRSYDQSQAFAIRPDMNRFVLQLLSEGRQVRSHTNEYED